MELSITLLVDLINFRKRLFATNILTTGAADVTGLHLHERFRKFMSPGYGRRVYRFSWKWVNTTGFLL